MEALWNCCATEAFSKVLDESKRPILLGESKTLRS